ncbi:MAG: phosphatase PAP2 family protein [Gemmatimonadales bacterium]|nr:phosphatase PAP2 family protein [Gemmatimonadales bacterium]
MFAVGIASPIAAQVNDTTPVRNVGWVAVGTTAAIIAFTALFDPALARAAAHDQSDALIRFSDNVDRAGEVSVIAPVVLGTAAVGLLTHRPEVLRLSVRTATAIGVVSVVVQGIKLTVGRSRPFQDPDFDGTDLHPFSGGSTSFPSGHTAAAFALATTLGDAIGSTVVQGGLYVVAAGTGWARIAQQKHWASDVVAGAAIGILAGKLAAGKVSVFGLTAPRVLVAPDAVVTGFTLPLPRVR